MDLGGYICASMREGRGAHSGSGRLPNDSVAQLVEQYTFNVWVLGSNPSGITKEAERGFRNGSRLGSYFPSFLYFSLWNALCCNPKGF